MADFNPDEVLPYTNAEHAFRVAIMPPIYFIYRACTTTGPKILCASAALIIIAPTLALVTGFMYEFFNDVYDFFYGEETYDEDCGYERGGPDEVD